VEGLRPRFSATPDKQHLSPDTLLKKVIRPAITWAGIKGQEHRHSLATNLRAAGADLKTV
jgi:site-specific recombinase XerD